MTTHKHDSTSTIGRLRSLAALAWTSISVALLLGTLLLAAFVIVIPKAINGVPLTILTGSMRPGLEPGDMVVVKPTSPTDIRIGDVITVQPKSGEPTLVTHRVTRVAHSTNGTLSFTLRGDNNNVDDPPVIADQVMGRVVYAVPYFGHVANKVHTGQGPTVARWAAIGLIGYGVTLTLITIRPRRKREHTDEVTPREPGAQP